MGTAAGILTENEIENIESVGISVHFNRLSCCSKKNPPSIMKETHYPHTPKSSRKPHLAHRKVLGVLPLQHFLILA